MGKRSPKLRKGPPPDFKPSKGRKASPADVASMWDSEFIPPRFKPATDEILAAHTKRLGIRLPASLRRQLLVRNGGYFPSDLADGPLEEACPLWMNAAIDGIRPIEEWQIAAKYHWFDNVRGVAGLDLLVVIASHSEAQLCLDYRTNGAHRNPSLTFFDVSTHPTEVVSVAPSVDAFIDAMIQAKRNLPT